MPPSMHPVGCDASSGVAVAAGVSSPCAGLPYRALVPASLAAGWMGLTASACCLYCLLWC